MGVDRVHDFFGALRLVHPLAIRGFREQLHLEMATVRLAEVLSPGNRPAEMGRKFQFYQRYGVLEYYIYDPDDGFLQGWRRVGDHLEEVLRMAGFVSPRLGIRFDPGEGLAGDVPVAILG